MAAGGAAVDAVLLLHTPPGVFARIVPFLIASDSVALLAQPSLTAGLARHHNRATALAWPLTGLMPIYSGYFGAGSGVLLFAALLMLVEDRPPEANAIKNMLVGTAAAVSAAIFRPAGPVDWKAAVPLATGLFLGSTAGPVIARRMSTSAARRSVAGRGIALAVELWINPV